MLGTFSFLGVFSAQGSFCAVPKEASSPCLHSSFPTWVVGGPSCGRLCLVCAWWVNIFRVVFSDEEPQTIYYVLKKRSLFSRKG